MAQKTHDDLGVVGTVSVEILGYILAIAPELFLTIMLSPMFKYTARMFESPELEYVFPGIILVFSSIKYMLYRTNKKED